MNDEGMTTDKVTELANRVLKVFSEDPDKYYAYSTSALSDLLNIPPGQVKLVVAVLRDLGKIELYIKYKGDRVMGEKYFAAETNYEPDTAEYDAADYNFQIVDHSDDVIALFPDEEMRDMVLVYLNNLGK